MNAIELKANPGILAKRNQGLIPFARAIQAASHGRIAFTLEGMRLGDHQPESLKGIDEQEVGEFLSEVLENPLRPGTYPLETLLKLRKGKMGAADVLDNFYKSELDFVADEIVSRVEARLLKVFLLGSAGTGVVSAVQDMVAAFADAGYFGRAFPLFDPSKKGAPVKGYGVIGREPILAHTAFEAPDIILLFDHKMFPLLRQTLAGYRGADPRNISILVNSALTPGDFRSAADFREPYALYTLDADSLLRGRRIPPNYAMIGGLLGMLEDDVIDKPAFGKVVRASLAEKFGAGEKLDANIEVFNRAQQQVLGESNALVQSEALGNVEEMEIPQDQRVMFEDGNHAISRAMALVLNQFPSVVAAYPITPQTPIVESLAQMIADGTLDAESVTPESEHGAGGAVLGAARDRVLTFTATSSQGFALMSEVVHSIAGLRMGNVVISNVLRSLNSPLDVENDHSDLNKVGLDAGFLVYMTRDVQQAFDFHLLAYLVSLYAEYRPAKEGADTDENPRLEMVPDRAVMLPAIVASEGFEVSHAPERYLAASEELAAKLYADPFFDYVRTYVDTPNWGVVGTLQLSNSRHDTDYQRHLAMNLAAEVMETVFDKFAEYTGRRHQMVHAFNAEAETLFVVPGAANGTFEEVARELHKSGIEVGVLHPNVLRPFPKNRWSELLRGKRVFVYDRDDPFGAVGGRLYTELAGVANEYQLAETGTRLYPRIFGLGGRTPRLSDVRDEILKALKNERGELELPVEKQYVGVSI
ncbi:MAG: hypothetical protein DRQ37_00155 [Gammaproteobacteria bacterium]|nr:MAG: hypothetical protein DRQ37_00155 [Gammaproteobacteria bacterium]